LKVAIPAATNTFCWRRHPVALISSAGGAALSGHHYYLPIDNDNVANAGAQAPTQSSLVHHQPDIPTAAFF
jgi:hypothetical protein